MVGQDGFYFSQANLFSWNFNNHQPRERASRLWAPWACLLLLSSCLTLSCPHLRAAEVLQNKGMKIFIKQTQKSITSSRQMLAPWWMANLLASRKCAVLTSDSFRRALYLNEVCSPHSRTRGEVQGSMQLLIKAVHQSPVFRMHLQIRHCQLTQALWMHDYKMCQVVLWMSADSDPCLNCCWGCRAGQALAGDGVPRVLWHCTLSGQARPRSLPGNQRNSSPRIRITDETWTRPPKMQMWNVKLLPKQIRMRSLPNNENLWQLGLKFCRNPSRGF